MELIKDEAKVFLVINDKMNPGHLNLNYIHKPFCKVFME